MLQPGCQLDSFWRHSAVTRLWVLLMHNHLLTLKRRGKKIKIPYFLWNRNWSVKPKWGVFLCLDGLCQGNLIQQLLFPLPLALPEKGRSCEQWTAEDRDLLCAEGRRILHFAICRTPSYWIICLAAKRPDRAGHRSHSSTKAALAAGHFPTPKAKVHQIRHMNLGDGFS